jgi:hypothetical protein
LGCQWKPGCRASSKRPFKSFLNESPFQPRASGLVMLCHSLSLAASRTRRLSPSSPSTAESESKRSLVLPEGCLPSTTQQRCRRAGFRSASALSISAPSNEHVPDAVDAQLRLQFLSRAAMLPSVVASDPAHDPDAFPVESLKEPQAPSHVLSTYNPASGFRAIQKQREHERLVSNLLRLKRNAPRPETSLLQLGECCPSPR